MKYVIVLLLSLGLTGCLGGGAGSSASSSPSLLPPADPGDGGQTPDNPEDPDDDPVAEPEIVAPTVSAQLSFSQVSSSALYANAGDAIPLSFSVNNPTGDTLKCNWFMEVLPNAGLGFAGISKAQFGTVNGDCNAFTHNQTNQLDYRYWVYINAGDSTLEYQWTVTYTGSTANNTVSITDATASGTYRVYDSKSFSVTVDDKDLDGSCSWKIDGSQVSTSCVSYTIAAAAGTRTLSFTIADGSTSDQKTWTIKPGAKITALTPANASVANGATQVFTATLSDPNSSGAMCEFKKDGVLVQARGACSYSYTGDGALHTITAVASYDSSGAEVDSTVKTAYAQGPANQSVSITSYIPNHTTEIFLANGETSNVFGIDNWSDPDGDAWFEWYINGVKTDCDTSSLCTYTNPQKNGIQLDSFALSFAVVKVVLTDGQYSASKSWMGHIDRVTIDQNQPAGTKCNAQGTTFWIYGSGFESADTITLQNQNVTLEKLSVGDNAVKVRLPSTVSPGSQKIRIVKSYNANQSPSGTTGSTVETAFGFVTFTTASQYCQ